MMVLFTGSRDWPDYRAVCTVTARLADLLGPFRILHGGARGVDTFAGMAGRLLGLEVLPPMLPDYARYGQYEAPKRRNIAMLEQAPNYVVGFLHGGSGGTLHCIGAAVNVYRIPTVVIRSI